MSAPKWILLGTVTLFSLIGIAAIVKKIGGGSSAHKGGSEAVPESSVLSVPVLAKPASVHSPVANERKGGKDKKGRYKDASLVPDPSAQPAAASLVRPVLATKDDFPQIDRIFQLFTTGTSKLPIVETIQYSSSVSWLKGRPAWIADYATHFATSRHFIARSLNGKPDYFSQKVSEGSKFNVFRKDKKIQFYLLADVSRCKMGFYYVDLDTNERVLLKTYLIGLGRIDSTKPSGTLTPLGRYTLGSRVAIYQLGMSGFYQDQKVEMVRVFGTRWIPLDQEVERATSLAKGYGLQGTPWVDDPATGQLVEDRQKIGAYDSDGCIRLCSEDIEELYSIVLTKPTFIEIVKDFHEAKLPGLEVAAPSR